MQNKRLPQNNASANHIRMRSRNRVVPPWPDRAIHEERHADHHSALRLSVGLHFE